MTRRGHRLAGKTARKGMRSWPSATGLPAVLAAAAKHREAGRLGKAEASYRRVLKAAPEQPDALHWLGVLEHKRGHNERATDLLERAAALRPGDPLCLYHLGEIRRAVGRYPKAIESYRQALSLKPGVADIHYGLGTALLEAGCAEEAVTELSRAVGLSPNDPEAHNNLANALADVERVDAAVTHYRTALALRPGYAEAHLNLGLAFVQIGRDEEAEPCFCDASAADPELAEARRQLALLLLRAGRADESLKLFRELIEAQPASAAAAHDLGNALQSLERYQDAVAWYRKVIQLSPDHADAHNNLGHCLAKLGRFEEALSDYHSAVRLRPDFAEAHFNIGLCLQSVGRFDEAVEAHQRALAHRPDLTEAHYNLSMIKRDKVDDDEIARLEVLLAKPDLAEEGRVNISFALAKIHEDRGNVDTAFAYYRGGNDLKARTLTFDAERHVDYVDRVIATFDQDFFAARRDFGVCSDLPVFIVGMPRSGTTLVEQILSSHPAVHGAGELDDVRHLVNVLSKRLETDTPYPECAAEVDRSTSEALAQEHLDSLQRRFPALPRITDKMTGNYLRLGLIALLLPKAAIIHCRRDPLDTCLSCYFQNFANGLNFTYDLGHLGLVYRQYDRLMAHWSRALPVPILELRYEDLIADPEATSKRIVDFCNLPWNERCLNFHDTTRQVRTASFWQVRQPVYATSIGRWCPFAHHLGPLFEMLDYPKPEGE